MSADERARFLARQGLSFLTAESARVVYPPKEGESYDSDLVDVPKDGKTIGEIVVRGNIAMREVSVINSLLLGVKLTISLVVLPRS